MILSRSFRSVFFGGSRSLSGPAAASLADLASLFALEGGSVFVGCASGADAAVLRSVFAASPASLSVFAVGGPAGAGFFACSAPFWLLRQAADAGVRVAWWAGGGPSVPPRSRLAIRTRVGVRAAAGSPPAAAVFGLSGPVSVGSLAAAGFAASLGLPVFALCPSLPGPPRGVSGSWSEVRVHGVPCWRFAPLGVQPALF